MTQGLGESTPCVLISLSYLLGDPPVLNCGGRERCWALLTGRPDRGCGDPGAQVSEWLLGGGEAVYFWHMDAALCYLNLAGHHIRDEAREAG